MPVEQAVIAIELQSRRHTWHVPASLDVTRCGLWLMRPMKIEMKRRTDRKICPKCLK